MIWFWFYVVGVVAFLLGVFFGTSIPVESEEIERDFPHGRPVTRKNLSFGPKDRAVTEPKKND